MHSGAVELGGVRIGYQDLLIWAVVIAVGIGLALLLDRSRTGRGMVAAATDPLAATAVGINVSRMRAIAFALAFGLAALAGVLIAPITLMAGARHGAHAEGLHRRGARRAEQHPGVLAGAVLLGVIEASWPWCWRTTSSSRSC